MFALKNDVRTEIAIPATSLVFGMAVSGSLFFLGFGMFYLLALGLAIGLVFGGCLLMASTAMYTVRELAKQIGVWLGIFVLLPLSVAYGTRAFRPPPDWEQYTKAETRLSGRIMETEEPADKAKLQEELDRLEEQREREERVFYRIMFWVAYPVGLVAVIVGILFPVQAVGAGLLFGGLATLTSGCYSYWDKMGDWLRFGSLVVALAVLLVLGTWRFRMVGPAGPPSA